MALWRKKQPPAESPSIVVVSLAGRENLLPDFAHPLDESDHIIGRHDSCSIQLVDDEVSRQHVKIRYDTDVKRYFASDMNSANGTSVNGNGINREVKLEEGDVIEAGASRMLFTGRQFADHATAIRHYKALGEHGKGTLIR